MKNTDTNKDLKRLVGTAAAQLVENGMICGIGTGSTVAFLIEELGRRIKDENLDIIGVPTSFQSKILCRENGIRTLDLQECTGLDLAIDGADEVDPKLNAIKGGGAAHTMEKIVAAMAKRFVIIVDESKLVRKLGTTFPVPVEIIPSALGFITANIRDWGGEPQLRMGIRKDGPVITDNGQLVIDIKFKAGTNLRKIDNQLHQLPGVIETGLFYDLAQQVLVGSGKDMSVRTMTRQ
jgi:ribose 5-phosphate isomerase A